MKVTTPPQPVYVTPSRKVEKSLGQMGDSASQNGGYRQLSFEQLRQKMKAYDADTRPQGRLGGNIDPRLAVAITAANSNGNEKLFSLKKYQDDNVDIIHDHADVRGKSTNIEI